MKANKIIILVVLVSAFGLARPITDEVATKETIEQYAKYYEQIAAQRAKYFESHKTQLEYSDMNDIALEKKELKEEQKTVSPVKFGLYQNYPNPFNPSTTIKFDISTRSKVDLRIYDIIGREIAVLISETKEPGSYSVKFNASNLSSGIYFYRLAQSDVVITKKMTLLK